MTEVYGWGIDSSTVWSGEKQKLSMWHWMFRSKVKVCLSSEVPLIVPLAVEKQSVQSEIIVVQWVLNNLATKKFERLHFFGVIMRMHTNLC